jgi:hypothetical protein
MAEPTNDDEREDSNTPDYNVCIEDPNTEELHRVGALWDQDSEDSPLSGTMDVCGIRRRLVLFENDSENDDAPALNVCLEDPLDDDGRLHRVGALWEQDGDKSPYSGTIELAGTSKRLVLFRNEVDGGA